MEKSLLIFGCLSFLSPRPQLERHGYRDSKAPFNHIARKPHLGLAWQILIGLVIGIVTGLVLDHFRR